VPIEEDLGMVLSPRLPRTLEPRITKWKRQHEVDLVNSLLGSERGAVLGIDETLAQLQRGGIGRLILARGLDASLRQCAKCTLTNRSADPACPACGGEWRSTTLREILPELAWSCKTKVEVVAGEAAKKLSTVGAMGGWLRQSKHGELP
jgi:peptide subunit release factor 1 (eRF1)